MSLSVSASGWGGGTRSGTTAGGAHGEGPAATAGGTDSGSSPARKDRLGPLEGVPAVSRGRLPTPGPSDWRLRR
eukprot:15484174-Alexandrium_andersonii.AAC.1